MHLFLNDLSALFIVQKKRGNEFFFLKRSNEVYACFIRTNKDKIVIEDRKKRLYTICAHA